MNAFELLTAYIRGEISLDLLLKGIGELDPTAINQSKNETTPLGFALLLKIDHRLAIVEALLKAGAKIDQEVKFGDRRVTLLQLALERRAIDEAKLIAEAIRPESERKLADALSRGSMNEAMSLIQNGANVNVKARLLVPGREYSTPFKIVFDYLRRQIGLLKTFAPPSKEHDQIKSEFEQGLELLELLVKKGADVNQPLNEKGQTALDIAIEIGNASLEKTLRALNASPKNNHPSPVVGIFYNPSNSVKSLAGLILKGLSNGSGGDNTTVAPKASTARPPTPTR